ncbi:hypothetical protein ACWATR_38690 [Nostoc sp. UIC 10890]
MNPESLEINSHPLLLETTNVSNEQASDIQEIDVQLTVSDNLQTKNISPEEILAFNEIKDLGTTHIKEEQQPAESLKTPIQPFGTIQSLLPLSEAFFKYLRLIVPWLWAVVIVVVFIPMIGQLFIAKAFQAPATSSSPPPALVTPAKPTPQAIDWNLVKKSVHKELKVAYKSAEDYASKELDAWADDLINRVDSNFLDWYFSYFNQKKIEYKAFFSGIATNMGRWLNPNSQVSQERIAEIITEDFQTEFAKRVLRPQISQLRLERITTQTVQHYFNAVDANITLIPKYQQISQPDWNRYLHDLSIDIVNVEGKKSKLTGKALLAGEAYLAFKPLIIKMIPTIGSKVVLKLAGKAGAKIAAKTGGILASKVGTVLLDSTVGVGILLWDVWDNHHTASIEKPILRDNLAQYLREVKGSLLNNPDNGIMTVVEKIQQSIEQSLDLAQDLTSENLS